MTTPEKGVSDLNRKIEDFFKHHPKTSQTECDALAGMMGLRDVSPAPIQGCHSYTVSDKDGMKIVQFRHKDSLDWRMYKTIQETYGDFVPDATYCGKSSSGLYVYMFDKVPGITFMEMVVMDGSVADKVQQTRLTNFVEGLARFFARSWTTAEETDPEARQDLLEKLLEKFDKVAASLPARYDDLTAAVKLQLPSLFDGSLPIVPTHTDLNCVNMMVDPRSGELNGIIDWSDANMSPFGLSLRGLDEALGSMASSAEWQYRPYADDLRKRFWAVFKEATDGRVGPELMEKIVVARNVGALLCYGYGCGSFAQTESLRYIDGLLAEYL